MTTPDPKPDNAPFEWRALTINKVERIQLERLHKEQDRIERETREREADERATREREAKERDRDSLESAWFEAGEQVGQELDASEPLVHPSGAERRIKSIPPPKPRPSHPAPAPRRESPVNVGLVLAACAFGASVYFSLRWVADVRQAHVAQQLSSTVNATTPAFQQPSAVSQHVNPTPVRPTRTNAVAPLPLAPPSSATTDVAPPPMAADSPTANPGGAINSKPSLPRASQSLTPEAIKPTLPHPTGEPTPTVNAAAPAVSTSGSGGRPRLLVPSSGAPQAHGLRVYRAGD